MAGGMLSIFYVLNEQNMIQDKLNKLESLITVPDVNKEPEQSIYIKIK